MARRHLTLTVLVVFAVFFSLSYLYSKPASASATRDAARLLQKAKGSAHAPLANMRPGSKAEPTPAADTKPDSKLDLGGGIPGGLLEGDSIAPKLENATLKAELGRATWKFLHTMVAKYPEKPTPDDRKTLELFFLSFGRLYPCGDCARHFRGLLKEMPPQTSSRNAAAGWLCEAHNRVNKRLKKPVFDCNNIGDFYDCGCGDDKKAKDGKDSKGGAKVVTELMKKKSDKR
ncbi:hypothetical protein HIM_07585 [Hirsutella minnesotensis 3608]|uniref:Sulfhydryl oxidase n=1 Tax=Hirsutella minnesotensis 3608 TaxID=1043627 RepID=A0A0F7ZTF3_9HYPO|nr:hypothetical protein HIM_07585 [Hirsutella minnesotensis 3608]